MSYVYTSCQFERGFYRKFQGENWQPQMSVSHVNPYSGPRAVNVQTKTHDFDVLLSFNEWVKNIETQKLKKKNELKEILEIRLEVKGVTFEVFIRQSGPIVLSG